MLINQKMTKALKKFAKFKISGDGSVYVLSDAIEGKSIFQQSGILKVNHLQVNFGGKYRLLKDEMSNNEIVLKISLKVKNKSEEMNSLESWMVKCFDANGVELDKAPSYHFNDNRAIYDDIDLLPGASVTQNLYIRYDKSPSVVVTISLYDQEENDYEYISLLLVEKDSFFEELIKENDKSDVKEKKALRRGWYIKKTGIDIDDKEKIAEIDKTIEEDFKNMPTLIF